MSKEKRCSKCKKYKDIDLFSNCSAKKDGKKSHCKECVAEYRRENKEDRNEYRRNLRKRHKEENTIKYQRNLEVQRHRRILRNFIKSLSVLENGATIPYLGCNAVELAEYLQSKAEENGCVDFDIYNYDSSIYHIDHIKPLSLYINEKIENPIELYHYTNIQILPKLNNLRKAYT